LMACSLNSAVYSCFGILFTFRPSDFDGNHRPLEDEKRRAAQMDRAYVSRMVNLTTLAPDIVAAILDETLPDHVTLFDLASGTPLLWDEQRALLRKKQS